MRSDKPLISVKTAESALTRSKWTTYRVFGIEKWASEELGGKPRISREHVVGSRSSGDGRTGLSQEIASSRQSPSRGAGPPCVRGQ